MTSWQFTPPALLYLAATLLSFGFSIYAWQLRPVRGAILFSLMNSFTGIWSFGYLIGFFSALPTVKLFMLRVEYLGVIGTVTLWFFYIARYTHNDPLLSRKFILIISIIPALTFLQILTVRQHNFFYRSYEFVYDMGLLVSAKEYGPGFYLWIGYSYTIMIISVGLLVRGMFSMPDRFRNQIVLLVVVSTLVLIPNLFLVLDIHPLAPYDPTSMTFVVIGILMIFTMRYLRFLDVVPVAYHLVFDSIKNGVIIIDERTRVQELNPAAQALLKRTQKEVLGKPIFEIFPERQNLIDSLGFILEAKTEIKLNQDQFFELQITPIINQSGEADGRIIMFYDISDRKKAELDLRRQVSIDPLTGVFNRRYFFSFGAQVFHHARQLKHDLSLLLVDIEQQKRINRLYGHKTGDQVLKFIASHLKKHLRHQDLLSRYNGEEFVILMPDIPPTNANAIAQQIQLSLAHKPHNIRNLPIPITVCIGMASIDFTSDASLDVLIDKAEQALCTSKATRGEIANEQMND